MKKRMIAKAAGTVIAGAALVLGFGFLLLCADRRSA